MTQPATPPAGAPPAPASTPPSPAGPLSPTDLAVYQQEFASKGALSSESYAALAQRGLSKELVDGYIAGQQARTTGHYDAIAQATGGKEGFAKVAQWADANVPEAERAAIQKMIEGGDTTGAVAALKGLKARMDLAGRGTVELSGGRPAGSAVQPFATNQEALDAMADPQYETSEAYRTAYDARMAASPHLLTGITVRGGK